jgi:hypothetical protein
MKTKIKLCFFIFSFIIIIPIIYFLFITGITAYSVDIYKDREGVCPVLENKTISVFMADIIEKHETNTLSNPNLNQFTKTLLKYKFIKLKWKMNAMVWVINKTTGCN